MIMDELDGEATETFSFRMSKSLREKLRAEAGTYRRTLGREVVLRLIKSFEGDLTEDDAPIRASPTADLALAIANANGAKIAALEARVATLEKNG